MIANKGLGNRGRRFIRDVLEILPEIEIVAVTDTYAQGSIPEEYANIPYISPEYIQKCEYECIVVTPENFYCEIESLLLNKGVDQMKIISLDEFQKNRKKFYCNICGSEFFAWEYIGEDYEIFQNKSIAGAGRRRGGCTVCGSYDRARFVYDIMGNFTEIFSGNADRILHFAPESIISDKLRKMYGEQYISADIMDGRADVVADITKLQFDNEQFEYIICNHVMEHVYEEEKAFSEIRRCLKPEGFFIFSTPICWSQKTYEDNDVTTAYDRIKYYGQEDHVRLYGNDIVDRIEEFGFDVNLLHCHEIKDGDEIKKFGLLKEDSVLLCRKNLIN